MREVNYLTDKSQDSEKLLSFKEQILRDLEEANEQLLKIWKRVWSTWSKYWNPFFTERGGSNTTSKVEESALAPQRRTSGAGKGDSCCGRKEELTKPAKKNQVRNR